MKQFRLAIGVSLFPLQSALAQDEVAKMMDPTTRTMLAAIVIVVVVAVAWVFYTDRQEKRRKQRRSGNKSAG